MVERLLARLTGGSRWRTEITGTDRNSLTVSDISYALAGLSQPALLFCQIKYMDEGARKVQLKKWLLDQAENSKFREKMCELALEEAFSPRICPGCRGRHEVITRKGLQVECRRCAGAGILPWKKSERARYCGISKQSWRHWNQRYESIYSTLAALDGDVRRHIRRKLR